LQQRRPAGYSDIRSFAWSPDGRRIAFSAIQNGDSDPERFVMNGAGGGVRRLTDNHLADFPAELVAQRPLDRVHEHPHRAFADLPDARRRQPSCG
jgi:hypothetical protein